MFLRTANGLSGLVSDTRDHFGNTMPQWKYPGPIQMKKKIQEEIGTPIGIILIDNIICYCFVQWFHVKRLFRKGV